MDIKFIIIYMMSINLEKKLRVKIIFFSFLFFSLFGFSPLVANEVIVIGTVINQLPDLPPKLKIGSTEASITWDEISKNSFNTLFNRVIVKGKAGINGAKRDIMASVWVLPENLVYLIDAGRLSPNRSQIFEAAKALRGEALLNDQPDKKFTSDTDKWGYIERSSNENQKVRITSGNDHDWGYSFLSEGSDKAEGLVYKLSLQPGVYKVTVAHVPCIELSFASWLRVNNARVNTQTVKTTISEDNIHPPVFVTHDLRLTKPTTITYETDKLVGQPWENASISLIAVEQTSSNIIEPSISPAGGDFWEPLYIDLTHKSSEAKIYYTLDGSKPDKNSTQYSTPFLVDKATKVSAIAYIDDNASKITTTDFAINTWAVTTTEFKLIGETDVKNVKINWQQREDANLYKIYRNKELIGQAKGNTYDDYDLQVGKTYTYYVEAYKDRDIIATSVPQKAITFAPTGKGDIYDNSNGKTISSKASKQRGMKIGDLYFSYKIESIEKLVNGKMLKGRAIYESFSQTGLSDWSESRELAFYPNSNFEGVGFQYNKKTNKVVVSAHYEDQGGYEAAKLYLAQITPKGKLEVGCIERPLGYDSRDQSIYIDEDGTAYALSATNMNNDINIYKLNESWTKPVSLINTVFIGKHRETPSIIKKNGEYYFFSSKASGWYPSQAMYASAVDLGGVWTSLREIGNNSTFGSQSNSIRKLGTARETFGLWSYHWGAQYNHKDPDGNYPRILVVSFNAGYASMDYYRYLEFHEEYGIIPVQAGRNLTMNTPVTVTGKSKERDASCITDGASLNSSSYFQGVSYPYALTIDMQKKAKISEINLSTRLFGGSETAYKYTIEGSLDGENYKILYDGTNNWQVGFQILKIEDQSYYRYLRMNVLRIINVHNNNPATWVDGIYELAAFGIPI